MLKPSAATCSGNTPMARIDSVKPSKRSLVAASDHRKSGGPEKKRRAGIRFRLRAQKASACRDSEKVDSDPCFSFPPDPRIGQHARPLASITEPDPVYVPKKSGHFYRSVPPKFTPVRRVVSGLRRVIFWPAIPLFAR